VADEGDVERLLRLVDAGVPVKALAAELGIATSTIYGRLRAAGRTSGPRNVVDDDERRRVIADFEEWGSITRAARIVGIGYSTARRILVAADLVPEQPDAERVRAAGPEARARFFALIEQGWSNKTAAREVGVHSRTGDKWRRRVDKRDDTRIRPEGVLDSGTGDRYVTAVSSTGPDAEISGKRGVVGDRYLTVQDRVVIADGRRAGLSFTAIAAQIGKHVSTVSREVARHSVEGLYLPHHADQMAAAARARPKTAKLAGDQRLRAEVEQGLARRLSPEQISNRLVLDHPDDERMRVSHETIYQALYFQARGGLKREVAHALRSGRTRRKPRRRPDERRPRFLDPMIMISERPAEVDDRAVPGHWEGDLIIGAAGGSAIGTLVERSTRYTMLLHLPDGHDAEQVRDALVTTVSTLPAHLRGSLTWDQGAEMARHKQFALATDMAVYFCDPASPWQRGTNENTNGLLRQYFPKGTDLSAHGPEDLEHVAQELNGRPRKTLDWETPAERLRDLLIT
jgi:transposase, IS30 family